MTTSQTVASMPMPAAEVGASTLVGASREMSVQSAVAAMPSGCYLSIAEKSPLSKPVRVMSELGLRRVVWFVLRGGTEEERERLHTLIAPYIVCRMPLARARRQMIICRTSDAFTDQAHIRFYRQVMRQVFGEKCRISVRVMRNAEHYAN